jgi:hypothetical protein
MFSKESGTSPSTGVGAGQLFARVLSMNWRLGWSGKLASWRVGQRKETWRVVKSDGAAFSATL